MTMAAPFLLLLFVSIFSSSNASDVSYISAIISESGLVFAKDLLVERAVDSLAPLRLPDIEKSTRIPVIGGVDMDATDITLSGVSVSSSTVLPGESGIVIVASGATVNLTMNWSYSYSTWLVPIEISDKGTASVQVEGMEVGLTITMEIKNGTLQLNVTQCGCYMENLSIELDGGASWFYQGFLNAFLDNIRSAVEDAITKNIVQGVQKLDSLLKTIPNKIVVDKVAALNVTFMNDPFVTNSSVEFDISGLFISSDNASAYNYFHQPSPVLSDSCGAQQMLLLSLDEVVFNSASAVYFQAGLMHWVVDKVPEQSLLNTGSWKYLIPQLYRKFPNDDMLLNITLTSAPDIQITSHKIGANILLDMIVDVLDDGEAIPVACISMVVSVSGMVEISGNNLVAKVGLNDFSLSLKWSNVGNFHMYLIQGVIRAFLNTVFVPYVNTHLRQGFPLPIIHGFTIQNANILTSSSTMIICSDIAFNNSTGMQLSLVSPLKK